MVRIALVFALFAACGPKHGNQCPDNHTGACVNGDECSFDRRRGCQVCQCRPWDKGGGPEPDDPMKSAREPR